MDKNIIDLIIKHAQESGFLKGMFDCLFLYAKPAEDCYEIDNDVFENIKKNFDERFKNE